MRHHPPGRLLLEGERTVLSLLREDGSASQAVPRVSRGVNFKSGHYPLEGALVPVGDGTVPCEGATGKSEGASRPKEGAQRPFEGRYEPREGRYDP